MSDMELITTKICMTLDLGVNGNLFGGNMMAFLDESGAAFVYQVCETTNIVTKKIEEVIFQNPVKVGNLIKIYGSVNSIGNTSITINLEARKYNVQTSQEKIVCSTKMVFVQIDDEGGSVPISEIIKKKYNN